MLPQPVVNSFRRFMETTPLRRLPKPSDPKGAYDAMPPALSRSKPKRSGLFYNRDGSPHIAADAAEKLRDEQPGELYEQKDDDPDDAPNQPFQMSVSKDNLLKGLAFLRKNVDKDVMDKALQMIFGLDAEEAEGATDEPPDGGNNAAEMRRAREPERTDGEYSRLPDGKRQKFAQTIPGMDARIKGRAIAAKHIAADHEKSASDYAKRFPDATKIKRAF